MPAKMLSPKEVGEWLDVPLATVYRWNSDDSGPRRVRVGRHVRYRESDVESWLEAQFARGVAAP